MDNDKSLTEAASKLGRKGGSVKSKAKAEAARTNGAKGGRPSFWTWGKVACDIASSRGVDIGVLPWMFFRGHFEDGMSAEKFAEIGARVVKDNADLLAKGLDILRPLGAREED